MTERDPGEGFFDHLDDPTWSAPGDDTLPLVLRRGRQLRARRRTLLTTSAAVAVTGAVFGGLGVSHALRADGSGDTVVPPASQGPSGSATPTEDRRHHRGGDGNQVLVPGGSVSPGVQPTGAASPPPSPPAPTDTCAPAAAGDSSDGESLPGATLPPLAPTPTPTDSCEPSPTPSSSPSETGSAEPTDSAEPTSSPT